MGIMMGRGHEMVMMMGRGHEVWVFEVIKGG